MISAPTVTSYIIHRQAATFCVWKTSQRILANANIATVVIIVTIHYVSYSFKFYVAIASLNCNSIHVCLLFFFPTTIVLYYNSQSLYNMLYRKCCMFATTWMTRHFKFTYNSNKQNTDMMQIFVNFIRRFPAY